MSSINEVDHPWLARRYEADKRWYNNFIKGKTDDLATDAQNECISKIRRRNPNAPRPWFNITKKEASEYISMWGR